MARAGREWNRAAGSPYQPPTRTISHKCEAAERNIRTVLISMADWLLDRMPWLASVRRANVKWGDTIGHGADVTSEGTKL
jgi:hypothetical protein